MVRVLLGYHSELVGVRLAEMLSDIKTVSLIGVVFHGGTLPADLDRFSPDVAVLDMRLLLRAQIHDFHSLKLRHPSTRFILLYDYPFTQFSRECLRYGAEHCFDTLHEFTRLAGIIAQYNGSFQLESRPLAL